MSTFMSAAPPANATTPVHPSAEPAAGLPAGLTDADAERITAAIAAARTESTRHVYALVWTSGGAGAMPAGSQHYPASRSPCVRI
jgi:hypothetical protein